MNQTHQGIAEALIIIILALWVRAMAGSAEATFLISLLILLLVIRGEFGESTSDYGQSVAPDSDQEADQ